MHHQFTPPKSKFPLLTTFRKGIVTPLTGTESWTNRVSGKLLDAMDVMPPVLWHVQNVVDHLPDDAGYDDLNIWNMPSRPPFDFQWLEYRTTAGNPRAISIARTVDQGDAADTFLLHAFMSSHTGVLMMPSEATITFGEDGVATDAKYGASDEFRFLHDDVRSSVELEMSNATAVALVAFMFSHCKNITLEERTGTRQEVRAAERQKTPMLTYREVVIDPGKTRRVTIPVGSSQHDRPQRSLHIARGHFATYTEDRPLFGKYVGTFWRPAHVRGSADVGMVGKNYAVKAP